MRSHSHWLQFVGSEAMTALFLHRWQIAQGRGKKEKKEKRKKEKKKKKKTCEWGNYSLAVLCTYSVPAWCIRGQPLSRAVSPATTNNWSWRSTVTSSCRIRYSRRVPIFLRRCSVLQGLSRQKVSYPIGVNTRYPRIL